MSHPLYTELAPWWPLLVPPEDAVDTAALAWQLLSQAADAPVTSILELGCGGGGIASHLPTELELVLTDLSEEMLALSRPLNPGREHVLADMRSLRLGRSFDAVLLGDAVMYMTTEADLHAALETAATHVRAGGAVLILPDAVVESFTEGTLTGGFEADDGTAAQLMEWHHSPEGDSYRVDFALLLRAPGGAVRSTHEQHRMGLFSRDRWWRMIRDVGLSPVAAELPLDGEWREVFLCRREQA